MRTMTFGSLFAGIGGFDLGFERAGLRCAWSVEIDDRCNEVRSHHWPDVRQYKDVRDVGQHNLEPVDVICGGFPCQDLSVAGRRAGLAGERSGLWWEFHRIIEELSPRWAIIENVPGLLSSNKGRDMGTIVGALGKLGYGYAWATLDAQFFGVAQRRRRVFIVGCLGDWRGATQVLFEPESGQRDSAPSRETGACITQSITRRLGSSGPDDNRAQARHLVANTLESHHCPRYDHWTETFVPSVISETGQGFFNDGIAPLRAEGENRPSRPSTIVFEPRYYTRDNKTGGAPQDVADITNAHKAGDSAPVVAYTVHGEHSTAMTGGGDAKVAFETETARSLDSCGGYATNQGGNVVAFDDPRRFDAEGIHGGGEHGDIHPLLRPTNPAVLTVSQAFGVRRLTPLECEKLQGFPSQWTAVNGMSDSARYRMLGNAVAVPVAEWIGRRIQDQERLGRQ